MPSSFAATPDLADSAAGKAFGGRMSDGSMWSLTMDTLKYLHIPKMVVPTGLTEDGRPCAIQLWGRALDYAEMFEDSSGAAKVRKTLSWPRSWANFSLL
jgi:Asp-tRNA(Asn)/Glu-tRNA(Gln) amidotransferase A subunit family amidase